MYSIYSLAFGSSVLKTHLKQKKRGSDLGSNPQNSDSPIFLRLFKLTTSNLVLQCSDLSLSAECHCSPRLWFETMSLRRFNECSTNTARDYVHRPLLFSSVVRYWTCEYCSCSDVTSWIAFCWYDKLRSTMDSYEVWRTLLFVCWPSSLELAIPDNLCRTPTINSFKRKLTSFHLCF